jgi:sortase A
MEAPMCAERRLLGLIEVTLWTIGLGCLAWCGFVATQAAVFQLAERTALESRLAGSQPAGHDARPIVTPPQTRDREPVGRLEIPRLHLSVIVAEGDDEDTLRVSVGHLPDTPLPWEVGNSALAGHRDTFFRPLKNIRINDDIRVVTPHGDFAYRVRRTLIVRPEDVWVLATARDSSLTLVTCYPFGYVGRAPQRFIVQGELVAQ